MAEELNKIEEICIQDTPPACTAKCPAHVDARGIAKAVAEGDFAGAYKIFSQSVPFPRIIAESCGCSCGRSASRGGA